MIPAAVRTKMVWLTHQGKTVGKRYEVVSSDGVLRRYDDADPGYLSSPVHSVFDRTMPSVECKVFGQTFVTEDQENKGYDVENVTGNKKALAYLESLHLYTGTFGFYDVTQYQMGSYHVKGNKLFAVKGLAVTLRAIELVRKEEGYAVEGWFSFVFRDRSAVDRVFYESTPHMKRVYDFAVSSLQQGKEYVVLLNLNEVLDKLATLGVPLHLGDKEFVISESRGLCEVHVDFTKNGIAKFVQGSDSYDPLTGAIIRAFELLSFLRNTGVLIIAGHTPISLWHQRRIKDYTIWDLHVRDTGVNSPFPEKEEV